MTERKYDAAKFKAIFGPRVVESGGGEPSPELKARVARCVGGEGPADSDVPQVDIAEALAKHPEVFADERRLIARLFGSTSTKAVTLKL